MWPAVSGFWWGVFFGFLFNYGTCFSVANKYYVDTTFVSVPRPNMEIQTYMKDGMVDNWDLFEKVLDYVYAKVNQQKFAQV